MLFREQESVYAILNDLGRSARAKSDDGAPARLRLCGDYTKVFACGNYHCSGALIQPAQFLIGNPPSNFDVRWRHFSKLLQLRAMAGNDEPTPKVFERFNDEIETFIRHQRPRGQIEIFAACFDGRLKEIGVDRWINDGRFPAIIGLYPFADELRIRQKMMNAMRRLAVPALQSRPDHSEALNVERR